MNGATIKMGKLYYGYNTGPGRQTIWVTTPEGKKYMLKHVCRHSADGFQWGYGGSGPSDAALSILYDCVGERDANEFYMDFKWVFIAAAGNKLNISEESIRAWLAKKKDERRLAVFQIANCVGCFFAEPEKIGTGKSCCTRPEGVETDRSGKKCLVRRESQAHKEI